jgi:hypothetical protein
VANKHGYDNRRSKRESYDERRKQGLVSASKPTQVNPHKRLKGGGRGKSIALVDQRYFDDLGIGKSFLFSTQIREPINGDYFVKEGLVTYKDGNIRYTLEDRFVFVDFYN